MDETRKGYKKLAVAVLLRAAEDAASCRPRIRASAELFLRDRESVSHWAQLANLNPEAVAEQLERLGLDGLRRNVEALPRSPRY